MSERNTPAISAEERLSQLEKTLKESGLPIDKWTGDEGTKTVKDLFDEVEAGETEIEVTPTGEIMRIVHVVAGDITYLDTDAGKLYRLREDRQVFKADGRIKRRPHLHGAVAEKMKIGEDAIESTIRGIKEELGLVGNFEIGREEIIEESRETETYPGLMSTYKIHIIPVQIDKGNYRPEGYIEEQATKTNYFIWEEV